RADRWEVIASHDAQERDLLGDTVLRLTGEQIKCRVSIVYRQWHLRSRAGVYDAGNCANLFQLRVDEGHAPVEVLIAEQRSLKGQQLFAPHAEIGIPKMLKGVQQQAATRQQHHGEGRLDDDERMLEPVAAPANGAAPCF